MAKIHELSPHVADLIAAGEVVERPGSVVKELVENSIDAGATSVTVEIKSGGMTYIRVTDNGCGMEAEDAKKSFLRHATSKLKGERDLECIGTLGFRGEALAAISAVSRVDLMTRETGADEGISISVEGGEIIDTSPAGCPEGTTMIIRDLFYNTPARLKFMKSDKAEGANVTQIMIRCGLSHPEISFRYIKDGKEEYHTPGDGVYKNCVYTLLGRDFSKGLLEVDGGDEDIKVKGFVTTPAAGRGNRSYQFFFINGRFVKSKLMQAALEQAYRNSLFTGKFPSCILYVELKFGAVDVNVHPTKTEVKFLQEKKVFDGIYYSALSALDRSKTMPEMQVSPKLEADMNAQPKPPIVTENKTSSPDAISQNSKKITDKGVFTFPESEKTASVRDSGGKTLYENITPILVKSDLSLEERNEKEDESGQNTENSTKYDTMSNSKFGAQHDVIEETKQEEIDISAEQSDKCPDYRIIGEAMGTYIIVEEGDRLVLIDKHAAHERILFDKMKEEKYDPMPQMLLTPFIVELGPEETEMLMENADFLQEYGFEIDRFGQGAVAMREVPGNVDSADLDGLLAEICEKLKLGHKLDPQTAKDEVLHTVACKAAIKAGKMSDPSELGGVVEMVLSGQVKYCPHGRPVSIELTKSGLDRNFKRI